MIRWCEHNRRSDGARGPQRRPCPLARGTRCVAGPGRGGSRPVSGHALHELSCPRGCHKAHPVATLVTGGREAAGGAAHLSGREAAADTSMATCTGHWPSGRRSFRKQRTVNPLTRSGSLQLPLLFSRPALRAAACGGRPRAGSHTTRAGGCRPTLGRVEPNRSSGRELEGSTRRLGRLVADAIRECLERDRTELNQGEDLPP